MRKKISFILLQALIMLCGSAKADEASVVIGNGSYGFFVSPYDTGSKNSMTQSIYSASEITHQGKITKIAYKVKSSNQTLATNSVKIYMATKESGSFVDKNDYMPISEMTLVYSGSPTLGKTTDTDGWEELTLIRPFDYDLTKNLVVAVYKKSSSTNSSLYYYYDSSCESLRGESYGGTDTELSISSFYKWGNRAQVRFKITTENFVSNGIEYEIGASSVSVVKGPESGIVSIPATVTYNGNTYDVVSICNDAFSGTDVTYVSLGSNIKHIGDNAFKDCSKLTSIKLPASLERIGSYAFYGCSACNFASLKLPDNLQYIGSHAFYNCSKLASISIPSAITAINDYTFFGCTGLAEVDLSENITEIGSYAFRGCRSISHIEIPRSISCINEGAFEYCGITSLIVPNNVTIIGYNAFNCGNLKTVIVDSPIIEKNTTSNIFGTAVEKYIIGDTPTKIANNAFYYYNAYNGNGNSNLKEVVIGKNISEIGDDAFLSCKAIEKVYYNSLEQICTIKYGKWASSPACYGTAIYYINGSPLTGEVVIPENVTIVNNYAFYYYKNITALYISKNVTSVGDESFYGCSSLAKLTIDSPALVEQTYDGSEYLKRKFLECNNIKKIIIGDTPTEIGSYTFCRFSSVESVAIGNNITAIGANAFYCCSSLASISIPESVKEIGENAFGGCTGLTQANFASIEALCNIAFPSRQHGWSSSEAEANPLYNAKHLFINGIEITDVIVPKGVTTLCDHAFTNCMSITSIDIPSSVTSIGYGTFYNCNNLNDIYVHWQYPPTIKNYSGKYGNLHVPKGMKYNYSSAAYWKNFTIMDDLDYPTVSDIRFSEINYRCEVGEIGTIAYTLYPEDALIKDVYVTTDGSSAIFFDENTLQFVGLEDGVATITVKSKDKKAFSKSVKVYVGNVPSEDIIALSTNNEDLRIGHSMTLVSTQQTQNGIDKPVTWTSSNAEVATVENGVVTALSVGNATITASIGEGIEAKCNVTVFALSKTWVDGSVYTNSETEQYDSLTYTRNFPNTAWQALYVPFAMQYSDWCEEFDVAELNNFHEYDDDYDGVTDRTELEVKLMKDGSSIDPNVPYLIRAKSEGEKTMTFADAMLYASEENTIDCSSVKTRYMFTGTYSSLSADELNGCYAMSGGMLQPIATGASLKPMRWYLKMETRNGKTLSARQIKIRVVNGVTDGIEEIEDRELESDRSAYYNVAGQRVAKNSAKRGSLLIVKGKKFINR